MPSFPSGNQIYSHLFMTHQQNNCDIALPVLKVFVVLTFLCSTYALVAGVDSLTWLITSTYYNQKHLYLVMDSIIVVGYCMFHVIISFLLIPNQIKTTFKYIHIILYTTMLFVILFVPFIVVSMCDDSSYIHYYSKLITSNLFDPHFMSIWYFVLYFIYPSFMCTILNVLLIVIYLKFGNNHIRRKYNTLEIELIPTVDINTITNHKLNSNDIAKTSFVQHIVSILIFVSLYGICIFILLFYCHLNSNIISSYFEYYFYGWIILTKVIKFILKRSGRACDMNERCFLKYISLEYTMEWLLSFTYWNQQRFMILYNDIPWNVFIKTSLIHIICEILDTSFRCSKFYFFSTRKLFSCLIKNDYIRNKFDDECDFNEWLIRLSMDIIPKCFSSLISGLFVFIVVGISGKVYWKQMNISGDDYYQLLSYIAIQTSGELIYYCIVFVFNLKFNNLNIFAAFAVYIDDYFESKKEFMVKLFLLYSCCVVLFFN